MTRPFLPEINRLVASGETAQALELIRDAIRKLPDFYVYHKLLGDVLLSREDLEGAHTAYRRAVELEAGAPFLRKSLRSVTSLRKPYFCGIYDRYPDKTGKRAAEGGLRFGGIHKSSRPDEPLVTIVTSVFRNTTTFQRCIDSVRNQTYKNIEYVVIDGGSDDGTVEIIRENSEFIDYYVSEPDSGIYAAMNKGIELSHGDYICLLNSDDFYRNDFVEKSVKASILNNSDIIYCNYNAGTKHLDAKEINIGALLGHLNICHNTFLASREAYNRVGPFDESYKIVSDAIWIRKAFLYGEKFTLLPEQMFTLSDGGLSSGNSEARRNLFIKEAAESYRLNFSGLSGADAEAVYLFRFNKRRVGEVTDIAIRYRGDKRFIEALKHYVEYCFSSRDNFKIGINDDAAYIQTVFDLFYEIGADIKHINLETKRGPLEEILKNIDSIIDSSDAGKRSIVHFLSVFSAASETFIYDLLTRLEADGEYNNIVLFEHPKLRTERPYDKAIHMPWADFKPPVAAAIYRHIFTRLNPHVVIGHFALNEWKLAERIKHLGIRVPTIAMTHGLDVFRLQDGDSYSKYVLEEFCERPDTHLTTVSTYLRDKLLEAGVSSDKITLVHNTVHPRFFNNRKNSNYFNGTRRLEILTIGRLIHLKGHVHLLDGIDLFRREATDAFHLTIVSGSGGEFSETVHQKIAELGLSDHVTMLTFVDFEKQNDFFAKFDLYVHASTYSDDRYHRSETFGVAVLEAIAAGLPVISTDAGGLPEVVGANSRHSRIVKHGDGEAIGKAMVDIYRDGSAFSDNAEYAGQRLDKFAPVRQIDALKRVIEQVTLPGLNVALFSTSTIQGAGYAAYRLHKGLTRTSIKSTLYTTVRNHESEKGVVVINHPSGRNGNWRFLQSPPKDGNTIFSIDQHNIDEKQLLNTVDKFDIVNLHWHARFLSVENVATLSHLDKPLVLTIRDMHPLTGGCHFFHGCEKWMGICENCAQIPSAFDDIPAKVLAAKRMSYDFSNITIVTLSEHTRKIVQKSPHFRDCRIETIPNSIETDVFVPHDKRMARKRLGLPQDKKVIAYVPSFSSDVKGYKEIVAAFRKIKQMKPRFEPIVLLVGNGPASDDDICFKKKRMGYIADNHELAAAYAAADVVVVPSLEETFSNTTAEAISCGVPVVGFKTGAIPEMAVEGRSGFTCAVGNVEALARGILKVLSGPDLSKSCREYAVAELSLMRQARRYEALFQELAAAKRPNQEGRPARVYGQGLSAHDLFKRSIEVHGKK